ncbi:serine/threonine protein kinase [Rhizohabitans arisaemae]|uniref:serine/threonine protein kinase n=1 Tax=Rhizohabitans arisaemae TaxID=2720610 RepID=UPI0024B0A8E1|nr:serine/threonine-protein kinase [Rhizohabitans arisaemae]
MPIAQPLRPEDPERLGRYRLAGRLGEGGQGVVYLAADPGRGPEPLAVKLLRTALDGEQALFLREAAAAQQVARFCTAQVLDAGVADGRPYIVSEYIEGPSLHREVSRNGPRAEGALERLAIGTATALAAIHHAGIVHRDFKPQNVLLGPDGPRVIDFGVSSTLDAVATVTGRVIGTPAYMSPEQVSGEQVGPAADVWAWGATIAFAANGWPPFGGDSIPAVLHRIVYEPPDLGALSGPLADLVARSLDKDPRRRPTSQEIMILLLHAPDPDTGAGPLPERPARPRRTGDRERRLRSAALAASGSLLASVGIFAVVLYPVLTGTPRRTVQEGAAAPVPPSTVATPSPTKGKAGAKSPGPRASPTEASSPVRVPRVNGLSRAAAENALRRNGLVVGAAVKVDSRLPIGQVVAASVDSGVRVERGTRVDLEISAGIAVPGLAGLSREAAEARLSRAGLATGEVGSACGEGPAGRVLATNPEVGGRLSGGGRVDLVLAAPGGEVPDVVGLGEDEARGGLREFSVKVRTRVTNVDSDYGKVVAQSPAAGSCAESIVITVAVFEEPSDGSGPSGDGTQGGYVERLSFRVPSSTN